MKSNKVTVLLLIGSIITGGLGYFFVQDYIKGEVTEYKANINRGQQMVSVVVAGRDLKVGDRVEKSTVAVRKMPRDYVHKDYIDPNSFQAVKGAQVSHPLKSGDPVLHSHLTKSSVLSFSDMLGKDKRAVTLPVDSLDTANGFLEAGDHIDLMITLKDGPKVRTVPLLENIEVIATGRKVKGDVGEGEPYNKITMGVPVKDATRLIHAQNVGDISILLRGDGSDDTMEGDYITIDNLLDSKQKVFETPTEPQQVGFKVIRGGKS